MDYQQLVGTPLFRTMTGEQINHCFHCFGARKKVVRTNEIILNAQQEVKYLYILLQGTVLVCKDNLDGNQTIIARFTKPGESFGEVYLFLEQTLEYYVMAEKETMILMIPKEYLYHTCSNNCEFHSKLIYNMLHILSEKAHFLSKKINLITAGTLRQKLCNFLLQQEQIGDEVTLQMNREQLAQYLNVTRPSLSRELIRMQEDGWIRVHKNKIRLIEKKEMMESL